MDEEKNTKHLSPQINITYQSFPNQYIYVCIYTYIHTYIFTSKTVTARNYAMI